MAWDFLLLVTKSDKLEEKIFCPDHYDGINVTSLLHELSENDWELIQTVPHGSDVMWILRHKSSGEIDSSRIEMLCPIQTEAQKGWQIKTAGEGGAPDFYERHDLKNVISNIENGRVEKGGFEIEYEVNSELITEYNGSHALRTTRGDPQYPRFFIARLTPQSDTA
jgi:hypothetical protein